MWWSKCVSFQPNKSNYNIYLFMEVTVKAGRGYKDSRLFEKKVNLRFCIKKQPFLWIITGWIINNWANTRIEATHQNHKVNTIIRASNLLLTQSISDIIHLAWT